MDRGDANTLGNLARFALIPAKADRKPAIPHDAGMYG